MSNARDDISYLNDIIEDCRLLTLYFEEIVFKYILWTGNRVPHGLAMLAQSMKFQAPMYWMDENFSIPPLVVPDNLN